MSVLTFPPSSVVNLCIKALESCVGLHLLDYRPLKLFVPCLETHTCNAHSAEIICDSLISCQCWPLPSSNVVLTFVFKFWNTGVFHALTMAIGQALRFSEIWWNELCHIGRRWFQSCIRFSIPHPISSPYIQFEFLFSEIVRLSESQLGC